MTLPFRDDYEALCVDIAGRMPGHLSRERDEPDHLALVADLAAAIQRPTAVRDILGTDHEFHGLIADLGAAIKPDLGLPAILHKAADLTPFGSAAADLVEIAEAAAASRILPRLAGWNSTLRAVRRLLAEVRAGLARTEADGGEAESTIPGRLALVDVTITKLIAMLALSLPRTGRDTPGPERRSTVTVFFIDIVGFTSLVDELDSAEVRALQRDYFTTATEAIRRHGGVIEKYVGDAVMAVFGESSDVGYGAENAVRAGLELQHRLAGQFLAGRWKVKTRIGVVTGDVIIDPQPDPGRSLIAGSVVSRAARLQAYAPADTVVVSPETRMLTAESISYAPEPLPTPVVRGESIEAWRVVGVIEGALSCPAEAGRLAPRLEASTPVRDSLTDLGHLLSDVTDELWSIVSDLAAATRLAPNARRHGLAVAATITERINLLWRALSDFRGADLVGVDLHSTAMEDLDGVTWTDGTAASPATRWPAAVRQRIVELSRPLPEGESGTFILRSGTEVGLKR